MHFSENAGHLVFEVGDIIHVEKLDGDDMLSRLSDIAVEDDTSYFYPICDSAGKTAQKFMMSSRERPFRVCDTGSIRLKVIERTLGRWRFSSDLIVIGG